MIEGAITSMEDIATLLHQAAATGTPIPIYVLFERYDGAFLRNITPKSRLSGYKLHYSGRRGDAELHTVDVGDDTPYGTLLFTNYWLAHAYCIRRFGMSLQQMVDK